MKTIPRWVREGAKFSAVMDAVDGRAINHCGA
jgi:hypothetical protein